LEAKEELEDKPVLLEEAEVPQELFALAASEVKPGLGLGLEGPIDISRRQYFITGYGSVINCWAW